jgi:hypothetical protein
MRDWYYIKEITNKNFEFTKIYCTSDSINLFRSVLYGISTINLHNNNIKYFALHITNNNKKYLFYKQISPSYFYSFDIDKEDLIKQKMFKLINDENTFIIKKQILGGNNIYEKNNLLTNNYKKNDYLTFDNFKIKKYSIYYNMDIINLKIEFITLLMLLHYNMYDIFSNVNNILENHNNVNNIENKNLLFIKKIYNAIYEIHKFTEKYNYEDLKKIDYKNITNKEYEFIKNNLNDDINGYKNEFELFKYNCFDDYEEKLNALKNNKFYSNPNYILSNNELKSSIIFNYIINKIFEINERENFGYLIKVILNEYDYNLFRNCLSIFYDVNNGYNEYIRGKFKYVETFDEDDYEYKTKCVIDYFYNHNNDNIKTEEFEDDYKLYSSKYDEFVKIISDKNI